MLKHFLTFYVSFVEQTKNMGRIFKLRDYKSTEKYRVSQNKEVKKGRSTQSKVKILIVQLGYFLSSRISFYFKQKKSILLSHSKDHIRLYHRSCVS